MKKNKQISQSKFKRMIKEMEISAFQENSKCNKPCGLMKVGKVSKKRKKCYNNCEKKRLKTVKSFHKKYPKEFKIFVKNLGGGGLKKSLKQSRLLSKDQYESYIKKKQKKQKLTKKKNQKLDHSLFINYCKCIKKMKISKKTKKNLEYPICMSSIYTKRGFKAPKDVKKKCKEYH